MFTMCPSENSNNCSSSQDGPSCHYGGSSNSSISSASGRGSGSLLSSVLPPGYTLRIGDNGVMAAAAMGIGLPFVGEDPDMDFTENGVQNNQNRRNNKPIMEKRRRARINNCINELKSILLEAMSKDPARHSKLEKADILELTVSHLKSLHRRIASTANGTGEAGISAIDGNLKFKEGFTECIAEVWRFLTAVGIGVGHPAEKVNASQLMTGLLAHLVDCIGVGGGTCVGAGLGAVAGIGAGGDSTASMAMADAKLPYGLIDLAQHSFPSVNGLEFLSPIDIPVMELNNNEVKFRPATPFAVSGGGGIALSGEQRERKPTIHNTTAAAMKVVVGASNGIHLPPAINGQRNRHSQHQINGNGNGTVTHSQKSSKVMTVNQHQNLYQNNSNNQQQKQTQQQSSVIRRGAAEVAGAVTGPVPVPVAAVSGRRASSGSISHSSRSRSQSHSFSSFRKAALHPYAHLRSRDSRSPSRLHLQSQAHSQNIQLQQRSKSDEVSAHTNGHTARHASNGHVNGNGNHQDVQGPLSLVVTRPPKLHGQEMATWRPW